MEDRSVQELNEKLLVAKKYIETIMDSIQTGIFTVGPRGYMKTINHSASEMLGLFSEDIEGLKVEEIVEGWDAIQNSIDKNASYIEEEAFLKSKNGRIHCSLSAYPIMRKEPEKFEGIVCTINKIKNMRQIANKMLGKRAIYTFDKIIGKNKDFVKLLKYAKKISNSTSTVLIMGESGTGKEVFAQAIHNEGDRRDMPFIAINCGALPRDLIGSELFGYEEGAFTGARRGGQPGKFELADGGTLFLDEIGEMPIDMQTNLLRVLERGKLFRIGGVREIDVDVRIIAATNRNLEDAVEKGNFRRDLYYRLNVLPLKLLPLRKRRDDIPLLIDYFTTVKALKLGKIPIALSAHEINKMMGYSWGGNVRELENTIERMINTQEIQHWDSEEVAATFEETYDHIEIVDESLELIEKRHIQNILSKYTGNITLTAEVLGIGRNTLYRKIDKYGIDVLK